MKIKFLQSLFKLLNDEFDYAILRSYEGLPENCSSRDIDILLSHKQLKKFNKCLANLLNDFDAKLLYIRTDNQFWIIAIGVLSNGEVDIFQLDIQFNLSVMGINLLDEEEMLSERIFNGNVYHLPIKYVFLSKYLYSRLLGAKYPKRYGDILQQVKDECFGEVNEILQNVAGKKCNFEFWESNNKINLRLRCYIQSCLRNFMLQVVQTTSFFSYYLYSIFFRRGLFISFTGPDGSGKTTVIDIIIDKLEINTPILFHFRPTLLPNLGEVGHKMKVKKAVDRNYEEPHRGKKTNILSSFIRLTFYMSDYILGYFVKIMPLRFRKVIVIFDRYFTDVIVDSERSSIYLNYKFITFIRRIIPHCQYNFLFKVDANEILRRKQELTKSAIEGIYEKLEYLERKDKRYYWIDNNGTPEQAVEQIFSILLEKQHKRYIKLLK